MIDASEAKPNIPVLFDEGSPYDCTQEDIDDYTEIPIGNETAHFTPVHEATRQIISFLDPNSTPSTPVLTTLDRLKTARWADQWGPDVVIKAVHDMDTAIFNGALRGKIAVLWADTELIREVAQDQQKMVLGMTASFGEIDPGTAMVYLNSDEIFKEPEPQKKMWETVIHELVHAYLDVTCGDFEPHPVDVTKGDSYSGGHGFVFRSILNVIFFRVEIYIGGPMTDALYQWGPKMMSVMPLWVKYSLEGDEEAINELSASMANTSKITEPKDEEDIPESEPEAAGPESNTTDLPKEEIREELNKD
ncbi:hypothetical protein OEA41_008297 [Lepraria neglecta]|uniref:SprT-like domain-containing protein n=1 Tax=Lepraria neglecta TaxID=209136 RepID=A0AAD9ZE82_9LECA|nr:hypothetical protein OEA41_008297 [Lepraria neglecta]